MIPHKEIKENKKKCINAINNIIDGLIINRDKIKNDIPLVNEDWIPLAKELNDVMNILINAHHYSYNIKNNNK